MDSELSAAPVSTLTISEYWSRPTGDVVRQEISQRLRRPGAKEKVADAISRERLEFKILWNRSLPINQLPYELLVQIFILGNLEYDFSDREFLSSWTQGLRLGASKLMGICRHWRDIIIETPAFWCTITPQHSNANWTELCIARSLAAPIEIWAHVREWSRCPKRLEIAYPLVHHVRSLYFTVDTQFHTDNLERDWTFRLLFGEGVPVMPTLEKLSFAVTYDLRPRTRDHLPIDVELTLRRFPRLRSLTLAGTLAPRDSALIRELRTLSLTTCSHSLTIDHFLDTLCLCTRLETLRLKDTLNRFSDDWTQRDPVPRQPLISLPRLDMLLISEHGAVCTSRFLAHIHVRSSVSVRISANVDARSPGDGACALAGMLPPSHSVTLESLAAVSHLEVFMCARPRSKAIWIHTDRTPGTAVMTAHMSMDVAFGDGIGSFRDPTLPPSDYGEGSVRELVEVVGHSPVTSLSVDNVYPDAVASWARVFRGFPLLERLSVNGNCGGLDRARGMENLFLGLHAASTTGPGPGAQTTLACPNLRRVSVYGAGSTAVYEAISTCIGYRGVGRGVVLDELELTLFRNGLDLSPAVCRACIRDLAACARRLPIWALTPNGREEGADLGTTEIDTVRQGEQ